MGGRGGPHGEGKQEGERSRTRMVIGVCLSTKKRFHFFTPHGREYAERLPVLCSRKRKPKPVTFFFLPPPSSPSLRETPTTNHTHPPPPPDADPFVSLPKYCRGFEPAQYPTLEPHLPPPKKIPMLDVTDDKDNISPLFALPPLPSPPLSSLWQRHVWYLLGSPPPNRRFVLKTHAKLMQVVWTGREDFG